MIRSVKNWLFPTYANNYKAYLLTNKALLVYTVVLILSNMVFTGAGVNKTHAQLNDQQIVALHNRERGKAGLPSLRLNYTLSLSARAKGEAMLAHNCWSHYCPEGTSPWKYFRDVGYIYSYAGENLAEGFNNNEAMMQAWMNSKTHRENVLKGEFTEVGIAMIVGDFQGISNNTIVVVHFGRPKAQVKVSQTVDTNTNGKTPAAVPTVEPVPLRLLAPLNDSYISDNTPQVKGSYDQPVGVEIDSKRSGRIIPDGGIFTYEHEENLEDGPHSTRAFDYQNPEKVSDLVNFTIDTVSPVVDTKSISMYEVQETNDDLEYYFGLLASEELDKFTLLGDSEFKEIVKLEPLSTKVWSLNVTIPRQQSLSDVIGVLTFQMTDTAGNVKDLVLNGDSLEQISQRDGAEEVISLRNQSNWEMIRQSVNSNIKRLHDLNIFEALSLSLLVMLLVLFIFDYLVINHSELKVRHGVKSRANLHIPFIAIMIFLVIMGNLGGGI